MTQNQNMKITKYLIYFVILVVGAQSIEARIVNQNGNSIEGTLCGKYYDLAKSDKNLRGIEDVWAKIKDSTINSWNYIKSLAETTKEKLKIFIENIKEQGNELKNKLEEKLADLKNMLNSVISDLYGTGELVKQCIEKNKENIEDILKEILANMSECISKEINNLTLFSTSSEPELTMNQTKFIKQLDDKMELCERDMENVQECLCKVREDIFDNFTGMENDILQNHYEVRNIADDIKETLVTCSIDNLLEASLLISTEIVEIAKCVVEAKENESELAEPSKK